MLYLVSHFGRIPVAETLAHRGVYTISQNCPLCGYERETEDHLLFQCRFTSTSCYWIMKWCGLPFPSSLVWRIS